MRIRRAISVLPLLFMLSAVVADIDIVVRWIDLQELSRMMEKLGQVRCAAQPVSFEAFTVCVADKDSS